jgi:hypothetical protein
MVNVIDERKNDIPVKSFMNEPGTLMPRKAQSLLLTDWIE